MTAGLSLPPLTFSLFDSVAADSSLGVFLHWIPKAYSVRPNSFSHRLRSGTESTDVQNDPVGPPPDPRCSTFHVTIAPSPTSLPPPTQVVSQFSPCTSFLQQKATNCNRTFRLAVPACPFIIGSQSHIAAHVHSIPPGYTLHFCVLQ